MAHRDLTRLIAQYRWLDQERAARLQEGVTLDLPQIDAEMSSLFLRIVRFRTDEPRISCAQIDFLVTALAEGDHDASVRGVLKEAVLAHVVRLAGRIDACRQSRDQA